MNKSSFFFMMMTLWLAACAHHTPPPSPEPVTMENDDADTIGEVVATLPTSAREDVEAASYPSTGVDEELSELTLENIKLRRKINQLKEKIQQLNKPAPPPPKKMPPPRKYHHTNLLPPKNVPMPVAPMPKISPNPDAPEVPTLSQITPNVAANDVYSSAQQLFHQKNYRQVIQLLRGAESGGDGSTSARRQMYLVLLSHQRLGNCQSVINIGQRLASHFSGSHEAAEAQFAVGQCQWNIQQHDIAKDTWLKLIASQPDSAAAKRAKLELRKN